MSTALGVLILGIGVCYTFFNERAIRFMRDRERRQWIKDLMASDLYSLFMWLGGIGGMVFGGWMIFEGLTS